MGIIATVADVKVYDITAATVLALRPCAYPAAHVAGEDSFMHGGLVPGIEIERVLPRGRDQAYHAEQVEFDYEDTGNGVVLRNPSGGALTTVAFDDLLDPTQYSFVGRAAGIYTFEWISETHLHSVFTGHFSGLIVDVQSVSPTQIRFIAEPGLVDLDVPLFEDVYTADIAGAPEGTIKQRVFGRCFGVPFVRVDDDAGGTDEPKWECNGGNGLYTSQSNYEWYINGVKRSDITGKTYGATYSHSTGSFTATIPMDHEHYEGVEISTGPQQLQGDDCGAPTTITTARHKILKYILETEGPLTASQWNETSMTTHCADQDIGFVVNDQEHLTDILQFALEPYVTYFPDKSGIYQFTSYPEDVSAETSTFSVAEHNVEPDGVTLKIDENPPAYEVLYETKRRWSTSLELSGKKRKKLKKKQRRYRKRLRRWERRFKKKRRRYIRRMRRTTGDDDVHPPTYQDLGMKPRPQEPDSYEFWQTHATPAELSTWIKKTDTTVLTKHAHAVQEQFESFLTDKTRADTEAQAVLDWRSVSRRIFTISVVPSTFDDDMAGLELGDVFTLTYPRYGCDGGVKLFCTGVNHLLGADTATITGWV